MNAPLARTVECDLELVDPDTCMPYLDSVIARMGRRVPHAEFFGMMVEAYRVAQRKLEPATISPVFRAEESHAVLKVALNHACTLAQEPFRILVLGCGEDYAGCSSEYTDEVVKEVLPAAKIRSIHCLNVTREALLQPHEGRFNLIVSHSVLHFIPELRAVLRLVLDLLTGSGVYVMAHEPNARFWINEALLMVRNRMSAERADRLKWEQFIRLSTYITKAKSLLASTPTVGLDKLVNHYLKWRYSLTANLSAREIVRFVDPHKPAVRRGGPRIGLDGLEVNRLRSLGFSSLALSWSCTYDHLGYADYNSLPAKWRERNHQLSELYPADGVAWTAVWLKQ